MTSQSLSPQTSLAIGGLGFTMKSQFRRANGVISNSLFPPVIHTLFPLLYFFRLVSTTFVLTWNTTLPVFHGRIIIHFFPLLPAFRTVSSFYATTPNTISNNKLIWLGSLSSQFKTPTRYIRFAFEHFNGTSIPFFILCCCHWTSRSSCGCDQFLAFIANQTEQFLHTHWDFTNFPKLWTQFLLGLTLCFFPRPRHFLPSFWCPGSQGSHVSLNRWPRFFCNRFN